MRALDLIDVWNAAFSAIQFLGNHFLYISHSNSIRRMDFQHKVPESVPRSILVLFHRCRGEEDSRRGIVDKELEYSRRNLYKVAELVEDE